MNYIITEFSSAYQIFECDNIDSSPTVLYNFAAVILWWKLNPD